MISHPDVHPCTPATTQQPLSLAHTHQGFPIVRPADRAAEPVASVLPGAVFDRFVMVRIRTSSSERYRGLAWHTVVDHLHNGTMHGRGHAVPARWGWQPAHQDASARSCFPSGASVAPSWINASSLTCCGEPPADGLVPSQGAW